MCHHKLFHLSCALLSRRVTLNTIAKDPPHLSYQQALLSLIFPHHFPHLLPPSFSVHLLPLRLFTHKTSQSAHTAAGENRRDKRQYSGSSWYLDFYRRQQARRFVRYRWIICDRVCSFTSRKFPQVLMLPTEISGGVCFTSRQVSATQEQVVSEGGLVISK